jgi:hypothetical protein
MALALKFAVALSIFVALIDAPIQAAPIPKDPPKPSSERLKELQRERVKALETQLGGQFERVKIGKDPLIIFIEAIRELGEAELDLADSKELRLAAVEKMVKQLEECEADMAVLVAAGLQTNQGLAQAKAARLKAEIQLEKMKLAK